MRRQIAFVQRMGVLGLIASALTGMDDRLADFNTTLLTSHNEERAAMGAPPLRWNAGLAREAQTWADTLAATGRFEHSPNLPGEPLEGENLWAGTPGAYGPAAMVRLWLEEKAVFKPGVFPINSTTGNVHDVSHYTQVIWARTREVGCALARGAREEVLVCRYSAPGNIVGGTPT